MHINIALDGPVGAGKSSIADAVAKRLSILHLDTGAMYRAVALAALERGIDPGDERAATAMMGGVDIDVAYRDGSQATLLDGEDVSARLRSPEVSMAASTISKWPGVRREMVRRQQALAAEHELLIDGRDIGTRVLPDAPLKIYLTASAEERARRRWLQQGKKEPLEKVLRDLEARDAQDMNRKTDPLRVAEGAHVVDSTNLTEEETVRAITALAEAVYGRREDA